MDVSHVSQPHPTYGHISIGGTHLKGLLGPNATFDLQGRSFSAEVFPFSFAGGSINHPPATHSEPLKWFTACGSHAKESYWTLSRPARELLQVNGRDKTGMDGWMLTW